MMITTVIETYWWWIVCDKHILFTSFVLLCELNYSLLTFVVVRNYQRKSLWWIKWCVKIHIKLLMCHEGVWGSGVIIDTLVVLTLGGGNYFVLCTRCSTALSWNSPWYPMHEKLGRPYSKCGYWRRERKLWKPVFLFLQVIVWLLYRLFQEWICLHLLEFWRKIMFAPEKDTRLIRQ